MAPGDAFTVNPASKVDHGMKAAAPLLDDRVADMDLLGLAPDGKAICTGMVVPMAVDIGMTLPA